MKEAERKDTKMSCPYCGSTVIKHGSVKYKTETGWLKRQLGIYYPERVELKCRTCDGKFWVKPEILKQAKFTAVDWPFES